MPASHVDWLDSTDPVGLTGGSNPVGTRFTRSYLWKGRCLQSRIDLILLSLEQRARRIEKKKKRRYARYQREIKEALGNKIE